MSYRYPTPSPYDSPSYKSPSPYPQHHSSYASPPPPPSQPTYFQQTSTSSLHHHQQPSFSSSHHYQQQQSYPTPPADYPLTDHYELSTDSTTFLTPSCAVCSSPPQKACTCELSSLVVSVADSESRILSPVLDDLRHWVTSRARGQIDSDFRARASYRKAAFDEYLSTRGRGLSQWEVEEARYQLKRDIDNDWREAVARYPEVLDHYYGIVRNAVKSGQGAESVLRSGAGGSGSGHGRSKSRVRERSTVRGGERVRGRSYVLYE